MRGFAESIADGDWGEIKTICAVIERADGTMTHFTVGAPDNDRARILGLLQWEIIRSVIEI